MRVSVSVELQPDLAEFEMLPSIVALGLAGIERVSDAGAAIVAA